MILLKDMKWLRLRNKQNHKNIKSPFIDLEGLFYVTSFLKIAINLF
jgi:hypothetical protein